MTTGVTDMVLLMLRAEGAVVLQLENLLRNAWLRDVFGDGYRPAFWNIAPSDQRF